MSSRLEILEEYQAANSELTKLKELADDQHKDSARTDAHLREQVDSLTQRCAQLDMLLEAINASED